MTNLFALCRTEGTTQVKRVKITQPVQAKIEGIFQAQAAAFLDGVEEEIDFGGDWKPDADEILVVNAPEEATLIENALDGDYLSIPTIDAANFNNEGIRSLFLATGTPPNRRILLQPFNAQQILARKFSLLLDGDTFKELTEPAFTLDNYLVAIIENGKLKFKSFFSAKKIFSLKEFYQEATNQEIQTFCAHESLQVSDLEAFKAIADEGIRKLVHAVWKTKILDKYGVDDIVSKANSFGLNIKTENEKILMPTTRKDIKKLLKFLDDGIYQAPLSSQKYITNSKRPLG
jgi:hypothetical protein